MPSRKSTITGAKIHSPIDFVICFVLASIAVTVSFGFLCVIRKQEHAPTQTEDMPSQTWRDVQRILTGDIVFQRFLALRFIHHLGLVAVSYYAVFVVNGLGVTLKLAGWLTGALLLTETIINPNFHPLLPTSYGERNTRLNGLNGLNGFNRYTTAIV